MQECTKIPNNLLDKLSSKKLIFTITSGRSGTALLAKLMELLPNTIALHEPDPRLNLHFRRVQANPEYAFSFLINYKLPAIASQNCDIYVETSHLTCKGFIEPILLMGIVPTFIILKRHPRDVAISLYKMDVIPGRTRDGLLVLLKPDDRNVMPLSGWELLTDYQLCFWYALEIERRQEKYESIFIRFGIPIVKIKMVDLLEIKSFRSMCKWLGYDNVIYNEQFIDHYNRVIQVNQNPRDKAMPGTIDREVDFDLFEAEREVYKKISLYEPYLEHQIVSYYKK